ncbi:MAG: hypothetical protein IAB91_07565 [Bacteroidetes bacterium]|uniref:Two component regulator propeller n=1 Tax=Candidatus Cryptobacteroides faecigallinarum TaxID=2840763 RepID=A0A9D9NIL1_9BACT|nr:hypothetical protein [Candidatus Cryptobacteroides faecigallinarum]
MEKIRFVALIFCLSFLYAICDAQELTPVVSQFDKEDYMAANQNWAVSQDADGIMYFGNGEGLLAFDGILWTLYNLPHNKIARSVMADGDRIYVGSYEEFGFFRKCDNGTLEYESLSSALTGYEMQNDEIWTILKYGDKVVFQAFASYFVYDGKEVFAVKSPSVFMFFSEFLDKIYTDTNDLGLALDTGIAVVPGGLPVMYASSLKPSVGSVYDVYFDGDGLYLATRQGLYRIRLSDDLETVSSMKYYETPAQETEEPVKPKNSYVESMYVNGQLVNAGGTVSGVDPADITLKIVFSNEIDMSELSLGGISMSNGIGIMPILTPVLPGKGSIPAIR